MFHGLKVIAAVLFALSSGAAESTSNDVPDYLHEAQTCSRIDLRPLLEKAGFEPIRNRGGAADNFNFALSEMLGLELGQPVSARWLGHWLSEHSVTSLPKFQTSVRAILAGRLKPCLESAVNSEDVESTRLLRLKILAESSADAVPGLQKVFDLFGTEQFRTISQTPYSCREDERTSGKPRASLTLTESRDRTLIDRSLRANRLPVISEKVPGSYPDKNVPGSKTSVLEPGAFFYAVAGRRLNAQSGRCEYLLRTYEGPWCAHENCEDGSFWVERESFKPDTVWGLEP